MSRFVRAKGHLRLIFVPSNASPDDPVADGIREKDKKNITGYLKQVSFLKDNTYHLQRHMWNDVSEDWQFYSEQERQCMKRRKPQNLTPPCSDGSTSSSGHSPAQASHHSMPSPPREEELELFLESDTDVLTCGHLIVHDATGLPTDYYTGWVLWSPRLQGG